MKPVQIDGYTLRGVDQIVRLEIGRAASPKTEYASGRAFAPVELSSTEIPRRPP
jgi:hypothetical protein